MPIPTGAEPRLAAALAVAGVIDEGKALHELLARHVSPLQDSRDRALARRLVSQTLRGYNALDQILSVLLNKPLARKDRVVHHLLALGIAQLRGDEIPPHAAVNATVEACKLAGKRHLTGLVNGVLKQFQRKSGQFDFERTPALHYGYPEWWVDKTRADWPGEWRRILEAGNASPPVVLRVNRRRATRDDYLRQLAEVGIGARAVDRVPDAVELEHPVAIRRLPGFNDGLVSVQDAGAQLAARFLELSDGLRVLDACAAPGGKACHVLESADVDLTALDVAAERTGAIRENLQRLGLSCRVETADAGRPDEWWSGQPFDRILIDAPCSSSGVVRRHPDVRWLRRESDLEIYARRQHELLTALWPLLKPGGILVYATCSIFHLENLNQGRNFLETFDDAEDVTHKHSAPVHGEGDGIGLQILPGDNGMDGFYYLAVRRRLR